MEDEIDLRQYILPLLKYWYWIIAVSIAGAAIAAILSYFVLTPIYEATALIVVRPPLYTVNLDPRLETNVDLNARYYKALPELAKSDHTLGTLLQDLSITGAFEQPLTMERLRNILDVKADAETNLLSLTVANPDPEVAANIANTWARIFYNDVINLYGESAEQIKTFETELASATAQRDAAQQALVEFAGNNQGPVWRAQLEALKDSYHLLLDQRTRLGMITQNITALRAQIAAQPAGDVISTTDDLTALLLQLQAFNAQSQTIQLQISGLQTTTTHSNAQGIGFLDELVKNIQSRVEEIEAQLPPLESQTLDLQQRISEIDVQNDRLQQDYDLAQTVYSTIANKYAETRISSRISAFGVQIASDASTPQKPTSPRKRVNILAGGVLGFGLSVLAILFLAYWRQPGAPSSSVQA
jgi:succinoglycan biosynthesis transport protein ExoP